MNIIQLLFLAVILLIFIGYLCRKIKIASRNLHTDLSQISFLKNKLAIIFSFIIIIWIVFVFTVIMIKSM